MADESPDQFRETSQDIYEVVAENHRDNNYETARKCQTEQTDESLSKNIDDAKKNPHDYEVIPEDFFLKQRELRGNCNPASRGCSFAWIPKAPCRITGLLNRRHRNDSLNYLVHLYPKTD